MFLPPPACAWIDRYETFRLKDSFPSRLQAEGIVYCLLRDTLVSNCLSLFMLCRLLTVRYYFVRTNSNQHLSVISLGWKYILFRRLGRPLLSLQSSSYSSVSDQIFVICTVSLYHFRSFLNMPCSRDFSVLFLTVSMEAKQLICNWNYFFPLWYVWDFIWPPSYFILSAIINNHCRSFLVSRSKDAWVWEDSPEAHFQVIVMNPNKRVSWVICYRRKGSKQYNLQNLHPVLTALILCLGRNRVVDEGCICLREHFCSDQDYGFGVSEFSDSYTTPRFVLQNSGRRWKLDSFLMKLNWKIHSRIAPNMLLLLLGTSPGNQTRTNPKLNSWNSYNIDVKSC